MALYTRRTAGAQRTHRNRPPGFPYIVAAACLKRNQRAAAVDQQGIRLWKISSSVNRRNGRRTLNPGTPRNQHLLGYRSRGQGMPADQIERHLVSTLPQLINHCLFGCVLRLKHPDAVVLHWENAPHAEHLGVQETVLDAVIQP